MQNKFRLVWCRFSGSTIRLKGIVPRLMGYWSRVLDGLNYEAIFEWGCRAGITLTLTEYRGKS